MEINFSIKVPEDADEDTRKEIIEKDITTIITSIYTTIPLSQRKHIKIQDGKGHIYKFTSFEQIKDTYRKQGAVGIIYHGKSDAETKEYIPTRN